MATAEQANQPLASSLTDHLQKEIEKWVKIVATCIVGCWFVFSILFFILPFDTIGSRGQFGDSYGIITSLFTGFTIIGLVYTILLQREEIRVARESFEAQKEELKLSTQALKQSAAEMKQQNKQVRYQRFENTFFKLIDQFHSLNKTIIVRMHQDSVGHLNSQLREFATLENEYRQHYERLVQDNIAAQLKSFENITTFVDDEKRGAKTRMKYFKLFFSQLSTVELIMFYYHFHLRTDPFPPAMHEYRDLFGELFQSNMIHTNHYVTIFNGTMNKPQRETANERHERTKKERAKNNN